MASAIDERKSAAIAAQGLEIDPGARRLTTMADARAVMRTREVLQDGASSDRFDVNDGEKCPVFFLDGEPHKRRRAAIARYFTPKAITTRYQQVMEETTDRLLGDLRREGQARLDLITFQLTVAVASDIVGLTESSIPAMAPRLDVLLETAFDQTSGLEWIKNRIMRTWYGFRFYRKDVQPAVRKRREQPSDDIISQCLERGYSDEAIMVECMTYATAGMVTTREFIVMVAWHMFDNPKLREEFLAADEDGQMAILLEILRIEPIAAVLYRRAPHDFTDPQLGEVKAGERFAIDLRAAHEDEAATGACPHRIDAERAEREHQKAEFMSFGDGAHHCPGWQVALHETRVFVERLLKVPGIRLERAPDIRWNAGLMSYELRNAIVACDPA